MADVDTADLGARLSDALTLLLGCQPVVRWCPLHGWTITIAEDDCAAELVDKLTIALEEQRFRVDEMAVAVDAAARHASGAYTCCGGYGEHFPYCPMGGES